jgi:two-component system OmpR family sensor kinase
LIRRDAIIEELREGVRARDDFLAIAAHELRNPLAPIKLLVHLLRQANDSGDNDRTKMLLGRLERQVERFISRMNVLLDVSQITSGKLRLVPAEMNLSELIGGVIEEQRPLLSQSGSDLAIDIEERVIGNLDSTAVTQIVDNLLSNAISTGKANVSNCPLRNSRIMLN